MDLLELDKSSDKEVFTVKVDGEYYAVINGEDKFYIVPEKFKSPLVASNTARKLRRERKIKFELTKANKKTSKAKIAEKLRIYTEAEVGHLTHLKFKEAWFILAPNGQYVRSVMKNKKVVEYAKEVDNAKIFPTYEDASDYVKTLDLVIKRGHTLRRFFVKTS
jgi:hypothetical protein